MLIVKVDLSKTNPKPLTFVDLAWIRTGSISDTILDYKEFDDSWEIIRIDFGKIGYFQADKSMIVVNEYDLRFFDFPLDPIKS